MMKKEKKYINGLFTCTREDEKLKCERMKCHKTKFSFNRDVNFGPRMYGLRRHRVVERKESLEGPETNASGRVRSKSLVLITLHKSVTVNKYAASHIVSLRYR